MSARLDAIHSLFDPAPETIYLDAATYGLPPRPTVEAMHQAITDWQAGTADWVRAWDERGETCRAAFARLIGVDESTVALVPSASVGVGTVAATLRAGDEVVAPDDEFTSVLFPLLVAARERGATVRQVPFDRLAESVGPQTTLVACSLIQSQSGRAADLAAITAVARANGAKTLIDATHAVPFVPLTETVDYLVCAAYKHLLSPRGVAFLYVARQHWDTVPPLLANWRSTANPYGHYYGGPLDIADDAARFDVSLAWFSWAGAAISLALLVDWQSQGFLSDVVGLSRRLAARLDLPQPLGSLVSVPVEDAEGVRSALADRGIKAAVRAGSVRLSPHVYNTDDQIDDVAAAIRPFVRLATPTPAHR
ncbi:MAG TPA: aminotransferase class V-fold PLP-dependent enzyme [Chloroflexota bacterium]|nr:aminotransferase class V-fold PLP-dependent enzyme [Chloroflexota bacterium]